MKERSKNGSQEVTAKSDYKSQVCSKKHVWWEGSYSGTSTRGEQATEETWKMEIPWGGEKNEQMKSQEGKKEAQSFRAPFLS